ncbi:hypothetical protein YC2023_061994 [Brassica napus]
MFYPDFSNGPEDPEQSTYVLENRLSLLKEDVENLFLDKCESSRASNISMRCHHLRRHESSALDDLEDEKKLPGTNHQQVSRAGRIWNKLYNLGRTCLRDANEI